MLCALYTAAAWRYLWINKSSITLAMCLCPGLVDLGIRPNPQLPLLCNKQLGCNTKIPIQSWSSFSSPRLDKSDFQTPVNAKCLSRQRSAAHSMHFQSCLQKAVGKDEWLLRVQNQNQRVTCTKKRGKWRRRESRELQHFVFTKN